jgi:hypothetical protein
MHNVSCTQKKEKKLDAHPQKSLPGGPWHVEVVFREVRRAVIMFIHDADRVDSLALGNQQTKQFWDSVDMTFEPRAHSQRTQQQLHIAAVVMAWQKKKRTGSRRVQTSPDVDSPETKTCPR